VAADPVIRRTVASSCQNRPDPGGTAARGDDRRGSRARRRTGGRGGLAILGVVHTVFPGQFCGEGGRTTRLATAAQIDLEAARGGHVSAPDPRKGAALKRPTNHDKQMPLEQLLLQHCALLPHGLLRPRQHVPPLPQNSPRIQQFPPQQTCSVPHGVFDGLNWFAGQMRATPLHTSATSHCPTAGRQTVFAAFGPISHMPPTQVASAHGRDDCGQVAAVVQACGGGGGCGTSGARHGAKQTWLPAGRLGFWQHPLTSMHASPGAQFALV
jgi:hypothetical protein